MYSDKSTLDTWPKIFAIWLVVLMLVLATQARASMDLFPDKKSLKNDDVCVSREEWTDLKTDYAKCARALDQSADALQQCGDTTQFKPHWYEQPEFRWFLFTTGIFLGAQIQKLQR